MAGLASKIIWPSKTGSVMEFFKSFSQSISSSVMFPFSRAMSTKISAESWHRSTNTILGHWSTRFDNPGMLRSRHGSVSEDLSAHCVLPKTNCSLFHEAMDHCFAWNVGNLVTSETQREQWGEAVLAFGSVSSVGMPRGNLDLYLCCDWGRSIDIKISRECSSKKRMLDQIELGKVNYYSG